VPGKVGSGQQAEGSRGHVKAAARAAVPPDLRKASGFPACFPALFCSAGRLSLPAERRGIGFAIGPGGKAKPFRKSGGRAAFRYIFGSIYVLGG
jgi:hypothetical protein